MITCVFEDGGKASLRHVTVHAIVEKDDALLLVKRAPQLLEGGKWSLPSGFMDRDENAMQAAERELLEETGWEGKCAALLSIITRPDRPHEDRQNVALVFLVTPLEKTGNKDHESTEVAWFLIDNLPPLETLAFDHGVIVKQYIEYRSSQFPLPLLS